MDGRELAIRFSYQPNALCYCGPGSANSVFRQYLRDGSNPGAVDDALRRFEGLYPYLRFYSERTGKPFTDPEVVDAYWIGNELSESFGRLDLESIIDALVERGLLRSMADRLIRELPEGFVPNHAFHVLYVGPGNTAGTVEPTLSTKDKCLITWGKVTSVGDTLTVLRRPLILKEGLYAFGPAEDREVVYDSSLLKAKPGDVVAVHWDYALMHLDADRLERLEAHNQRAVRVMNGLFQSRAA